MKKQLIAAFAALSMAISALPCVSFAADTAVSPSLRYDFDGKNELADQNGGNALKLSGGASVTEDGNVGKALLLDGVDGYALLPSGILTDNMTITAWVKLNKLNTWGRVFDFGTDSNNNFFFAPYSGGAARVEMKSPSSTATMDTVQETERDWVHYAITIDNGTVSYYRNGRLIQSKAGMGKLSDIKNELNYIGKSHYDGDAYLAAAIDDFRVYKTALDRKDICDVMAEGNINSKVMLDSYAIEDGQLITGDTLELEEFDYRRNPPTNNFITAHTGTEIDETTAIKITEDSSYEFSEPSIVWGYFDPEHNLVESTERNDDSFVLKIKHPPKTTPLKFIAFANGGGRVYTVYVTGTEENPYSIDIDASDRSKDVSDIMWGLFFEDINSAADGGLYAEMVQNRSFEMDDHLYSWETAGDVKVNTKNPLNENNPTYITLGKDASITNDGFSGMSVKKGEKYDFSMYIKSDSLLYGFKMQLLDDNDNIMAEHVFARSAGYEYQGEDNTDGKGEWVKRTFTIEANADTSVAKLILTNIDINEVNIDMVSLIPEDTYKGHGLRKDLMEKLEEMHPKFLRFPGGCAVEGQTMDEAWNWKDTIGDVSERKEMINIWNPSATEPYMMTYGLGFYEYFQMCEDLRLEPVPILNCGIACQVRSGSAEDEEHLVPMDKLQPYIDDALDLIAFANGTDPSNKWTKKRIDMGHPEPFNMKYIGIGNEQYGEIYWERYAEFARQIHAKYPDINLVTTSGTASSGTGNDLAWSWANDNTELADRMDEHYYETADWFRTHAYRYDNYRRDTNTKVFLGEYASKGNTWYNALSEAAFMTGLERNADVVRMASYAPMFAKYGNTQWSAANMIWFNNDDYVLTPNYHVQSLFSNNKGDYSLPTSVKMTAMDKNDTFRGGIVVGSWGTHNEFKDISVVGTGDKGITADVNPKSGEWIFGNGDWSVNDEGALVQMSDATGSTAWIDSPEANNYTVSLKAKKTAGGEGFQIGVAAEDGQNYYRVNIGGWGNTTAKIQHIVNGVSAETGNVAEQSYVGNVHIEDDVWYDVRVEMSDYEIKAYLNGEFICSYVKPKEYGPVYASSVYDEKTGEVIVKVVNTIGSDVDIDINISGANIANEAKTTVMSGDTELENSLSNKTAIAPKEGKITNAGNSFVYKAPANSFTVINLSTNEKEHIPYISGYLDGTFKPDSAITRAEAAAMIAKLAGIKEDDKYKGVFKDVKDGVWYTNYINFAAQRNYILGYENGAYMPDEYISRAGFAVILYRYGGLSEMGSSNFSDLSSSHWAAGYIGAMCEKGIINGYLDGTFKPEKTVTRAEAVAIINRTLGEKIAGRDISGVENPFSDIAPSHWAYADILKAAVN